MKKIPEKQFKKLEFKIYSSQSTKLCKELNKLAIGEHLFLSREEWKLTSEPISLISNSQHHLKGILVGFKFSVKQLADNSGWIITRRENLDETSEVDTGYRCSLCKEMYANRRSARLHLVQTHKGQFGRVMYIVASKRSPSENWLKRLMNSK